MGKNEHVFHDLWEQDRQLEHQKTNCIQKYGMHVLNGSIVGLTNDTDSCPAVWDGILCWDSIKAGETGIQACPFYIAGFDSQRNASRQCLSDGQWFRHPDSPNQTWTNYLLCFSDTTATVAFDIPKSGNATFFQDYLPILKNISQIGYLISLLTLVVAFFILLCIRRLHCPRNTLHLNLFASFILRAFMALLKNSLFVEGLGLAIDITIKNGDAYFVNQNENKNWICKTFTCIWQYCISANYSWIFVEGLYLHNLIFFTLFANGGDKILFYIIMGWGLPVLVVAPWILTRKFFDDTLCWTTNTYPKLFLIIRIPTMMSILLNFVMFVNITRVLFMKISASINEENQRYRKWARSTLVLMPLFGVHYTIFLAMSYSLGVNPTVELIWLFCDQIFASFQGFFVALLFCFFNGEVRSELKHLGKEIRFRFLRRVRGVRRRRNCDCNATGCSHQVAMGADRSRVIRGSICTSCSSVCSTQSCNYKSKITIRDNGSVFYCNQNSSVDDGPKNNLSEVSMIPSGIQECYDHKSQCKVVFETKIDSIDVEIGNTIPSELSVMLPTSTN